MKDFEGTGGKNGGRQRPIRLLIFGHVFTHSCKSCPAWVMMLSVALYKRFPDLDKMSKESLSGVSYVRAISFARWSSVM